MKVYIKKTNNFIKIICNKNFLNTRNPLNLLNSQSSNLIKSQKYFFKKDLTNRNDGEKNNIERQTSIIVIIYINN